MKLLVQRVLSAHVEVNQQIVGQIQKGMLVFLGVEKGDTKQQAEFLANKLTNLRIFEDDAGKMNLSVKDVNGDILVVSQFTLAADLSRGNRPGFDNAEHPELANEMYLYFLELLKNKGIAPQTGIFQTDMKVHLVNDGPCTFWLSKIYESQVEYLQNQLALLDGEYDDLIKENGDVVTEDGRRISEIKAELDLYFNNNTFDYLYSEITINGYVKDESYLTQLTLEKESLTKQQNLCQEQIEALREERDNLITSAGSLQTLDLESYNSQIVLLTNKKIEIAKQIDEIQTKIDGIGQDVSTFEATLQEYYNKLVEFTNEFCDTASYVVSSDASVRYTTGQIIAANGGMGRLSSTILCLLAGLVLGCCVNMIVDRKKFKEYSTGDKN